MSERDDLLDSVAKEIRSYREGDLPEPSRAHVDRWLSQFTPASQLPFLREFEHVIKQTFFTKKNVDDFLRILVKSENITKGDPRTFWSSARFLNIQKNGQSQKEMLRLFAACLEDELGLRLDQCGSGGDQFIYLDDIMFSGNRVGNDLAAWITDSAPIGATVHVILAATHSGGEYMVNRKVRTISDTVGKKITIRLWRAMVVENRKWHKDRSEVLWPTVAPDVAEVHAYMALDSKFPFEPRQPSAVAINPFSSEAGRQVLESEFFIAGAKIRALSENNKPSMRPLGFSPFGVGFGSMIATYRNCPNNCPLAMWWGDPQATSGALHWYPLLQREGYSSPRNVFGDFLAL